ncbi:hypothetical protein [Campylobacter estrildidarum]|uniref:Uncharacterized protein n=1 Tax=Campylobacter estrildidarum TaxID=2510189 RepID=A0A4U7BFI5_9BACT|nr:hypothetical protein [Campylobacter estrildidarum]TKX30453.1 hypothetical protein CQA69_06100 [Campylobacter estrildidarum]
MKDKSLEELDILKTIIFALSFITVCTALILFLLLPILKDYKNNNLKENSEIAIFNSVKTDLEISENKISKLKAQNNKILKQFDQGLNIKQLEVFLQKYFQNIQIKEINIDKKEKYLTHKLNIQGLMNNPRRFYDFIDALQNYDSLIKIGYPFILKATQKGIAINFSVEIYSD